LKGCRVTINSAMLCDTFVMTAFAILTYRGRNIILNYCFLLSVKVIKNRRMVSSGMLRRVALARTDVSEVPIGSIIKVTRIGELGTTLAVTSNRCTLHHPDEGGARFLRNVGSYTSHMA
jgi:hypothetical protein